MFLTYFVDINKLFAASLQGCPKSYEKLIRTNKKGLSLVELVITVQGISFLNPTIINTRIMR